MGLESLQNRVGGAGRFMSQVGQKEKETQKRVVAFFSEELEYDYLGDWTKRENRNVEVSLLEDWLKGEILIHP